MTSLLHRIVALTRPTPIKRARKIVAAAIAAHPEYANLRRPVLRGELDDSAFVRAALNALHDTGGHVARATSIVAYVLPFLDVPANYREIDQ